MSDFLVWPRRVLPPAECKPNLVPFTRSGGRSLGGLEPATRTDLGYWSIELANIPVATTAQRRTWTAISERLGGRSGLIAVPAWSYDTAPYASGQRESIVGVPHSDGSSFGDGSLYEQGAISVVTDGVTPLGVTTIRLRIINAAADLVGVRFSYEHALYKTGPVIEIDGDIWTVPISPSVRALIPSGADLEFDVPTCLCRLADDRGMDGGLNPSQFEQRTVSFVEATDYWASLVE